MEVEFTSTYIEIHTKDLQASTYMCFLPRTNFGKSTHALIHIYTFSHMLIYLYTYKYTSIYNYNKYCSRTHQGKHMHLYPRIHLFITKLQVFYE